MVYVFLYLLWFDTTYYLSFLFNTYYLIFIVQMIDDLNIDSFHCLHWYIYLKNFMRTFNVKICVFYEMEESKQQNYLFWN